MSDAIAREPVRQKMQPARPGKRGQKPRVDREGGRWNAGAIYGLSLVTRGEALGHERWVDQHMVEQTTAAVNAAGDVGIKSRFTHPGMSADGLFSKLGRLTAARTSEDGNQSLADLHFYEAAHTTPDGDLAGHVMDLAEQDPEGFGFSIVFTRDRKAEMAFLEANGQKNTQNEDGTVTVGRFKSPDKQNTRNFPHIRMLKLHAADAVDDPAANPQGLFHRSNELFEDAERFTGYLLGLESEKPELVSLDVDPERARLFLTRFLATHNLEIVDAAMLTEHAPIDEPKDETPATDTTTELDATETTPAVEAVAAPVADEPAALAAETEPTNPTAHADGKAFIAAFGTQGAVWFAEGKSMDEAKELWAKTLAEENAALKKQLADQAAVINKLRGETHPAEFTPAAGEADKDKNGNRFATCLPDGLARFAQATKIPTN